MKKFHRGDLVTHFHGSSKGEMDSVFSHYIDSERIAVNYLNGNRKGRIGEWQEKYCIPRKRVRPETSHITDPVNNGRMKILGDLTEHKGKISKTIKPDWRNSMIKNMRTITNLPVYEEAFGIKAGRNINQQQWYKMYLNSVPESTAKSLQTAQQNCIRGTKVNSLIEDEISAAILHEKEKYKYDDMLDALSLTNLPRWVGVDWAKGFGPKPENTMKAEIKTLYTDDVLTQTLINDVDILNLSASTLLNYISDTEAAISKLHKYPGYSLFVKQEISRLEKFVRNMYKLLDSLHSKAED